MIRKLLSFLAFIFICLPSFSQMVGSDIDQKQKEELPKPQTFIVISDGVMLNYEFQPGAMFRDASIGLTYYHLNQWGYYGNIMISVGGLYGSSSYTTYEYSPSGYFIPENKYKTAGFLIRAGGMYRLNDTFVPYAGIGYRSWERDWILQNGERIKERGGYQNDFCLELGCLFRYDSFSFSAGFVNYFEDTIIEKVFPNFKIGVGYEF